MSQTAAVIIFVIVIISILIGVIRARKMNKEQSALTMHPDNFKKPEIEQVEMRPPAATKTDKPNG